MSLGFLGFRFFENLLIFYERMENSRASDEAFSPVEALTSQITHDTSVRQPFNA
jgi:hypothetical protein